MYIKIKKNGSVLLITLLVVSALLSSVLYINTFSIRQISQAKNIDNSLVAYYAAEGMNEQAIYKIRKTSDDINTLNGDFSTSNNATVKRTVSSFLESLSLELKKDELFQFDFFDPENVELGSGLSRLSFSWEDDCSGGSWIELTANEWSSLSGGIIWNDNSSIHVKKSLINLSDGTDELNNIKSIGGSNIDPEKSYQFRVKAMYCNITNLKITAYDKEDVSLPFKNIYTITSVGEYPRNSSKSNKQALSITLKKTNPLSGLFDYVIFSEKSLVKELDSYSGSWYSDKLYIAESDSLYIPFKEFYQHEILVVNGIPPYRCHMLSGILPEGININNCTIEGSTYNTGTFPISILAIDAAENKTEKMMYLVVN